MIDFILILFTAGVFVGGFYLGKKYGSYAAMWKEAKGSVRSWL